MAWEPTSWGTQPAVKENDEVITQHWALQTYHFQPTLLDISTLKEFPEEEWLFFNTPNVYGIAEELNKYPQVYYAKFLGENNLYSAYWKTNVLGDWEWDPYVVTETFKWEPYKYIAFYNTETMKREVYSKYGWLSVDV